MYRFLLTLSLFFTVLATGYIPGSAQTAPRPMIPPMQEGPGLSTWLFGQAYGNTTGAFNNGVAWYSAGQGLHFGLDFPMACGTPLVAVADGEVVFVDNFGFGSRPHNLILRHPDLGLSTLYGHLLEPVPLVPGQFVTQGQYVGLSGDPDETCVSRPHLHLEVRSLDYRTAYNPIDFIEANWHSLSLIGGFGQSIFQMDLMNSRQWMSLDDQPPVSFGGGRLNDYQITWPPSGNLRPPANPPLPQAYQPPTEGISASFQRLGYDTCCREYWWDSSNADHLYTIDGAPNQRAMIFRWSASNGSLDETVGPGPRVHTSPDGTHSITPINGGAQISRISDASSWNISTGGPLPAMSTDNNRLLWLQRAGVAIPGQDQPPVQLFISDVYGNNPSQIPVGPGSNAQWLDATRILISTQQRPYTSYRIFDTASFSDYELGVFERPRALSIGPGGENLLFYLSNQQDPVYNGVYLLSTQPGSIAQKQPWFGAWRWRDAGSLYYIPFNPDSEVQQLMLFDLTTGLSIPLTDPLAQPFGIMNSKWEVSPDGRHIAFHNLTDRNLWLINIQN